MDMYIVIRETSYTATIMGFVLFSLILCVSLHCVTSSARNDTVKFVSRKAWGARSPKATLPLSTPVPKVIIHHTAENRCFNLHHCEETVRNIQKFHMDDRGWDDIGYNFLVGEDGRVYEGRGWKTIGAHAKGYNNVSCGISIMGNFNPVLPGSMALTATKNIISLGVEKGYISSTYGLYGHRDVGATECPGDKLYAEIRKWKHYRLNP